MNTLSVVELKRIDKQHETIVSSRYVRNNCTADQMITIFNLFAVRDFIFPDAQWFASATVGMASDYITSLLKLPYVKKPFTAQDCRDRLFFNDSDKTRAYREVYIEKENALCSR